MKKLAIFTVVLGLAASACTTSSAEGGIDVPWLFTTAFPVSNDGCTGSGIDSVVVIAQDSAQGQYTSPAYFCDDDFGETPFMPLDTYLVWVEAYDLNGDIVARSLSDEVDLTFDGEVIEVDPFDIPIDAGFFDVTWSIIDNGGAPVTCSEIPDQDGVALLSTGDTDPGNPYDNVFLCADGIGTTDALFVDTYTTEASIINTADAAIVSLPVFEETFSYGNHYLDLGELVFTY